MVILWQSVNEDGREVRGSSLYPYLIPFNLNERLAGINEGLTKFIASAKDDAHACVPYFGLNLNACTNGTVLRSNPCAALSLFILSENATL